VLSLLALATFLLSINKYFENVAKANLQAIVEIPALSVVEVQQKIVPKKRTLLASSLLIFPAYPNSQTISDVQ